MSTAAFAGDLTVKDPWPAPDDALEAARFIAERARIVYGDLLESVWLYGSRVRGDHRHDSDLDVLLVTTREEADPHVLRRKLREELTLRPFDLEMWAFLSLKTAYSEQLRHWDTMFYRNVRADAVRVL